ncbi:uncharacterized protein LOC129597783 [Paramacrobiotus metropolitanus]|uniref:uncharacterized protein LOC129597783 n=1 Tax=Paramacrobiotus metropolitanus TaxID=2943436 RepID=UPI0024458D57|nr:uncharacterized protein LOC129597783 [Paramacrobiotus metropolitanus]
MSWFSWRTRPSSYFWLACSWCSMLLLHWGAGCPAAPERPPAIDWDYEYRKAGSDLNNMLAEAMLNNRQDDRVILAQLAMSDGVTDSVVYRPRLGEDATFMCDVPAGSDWRDVSWVHQDRTIFEAGRALPLPVEDVSGQAYNFSRVNDTLFLVVVNVSMRSGGSIQCISIPSGPAYTSHRRVL